MATRTEDIVTEDFTYLRHSDRNFTLRLFRPAGDGPFPLVLDVHGGAWNTGDLTDGAARDAALAAAGYAVAAIDFRHGPDGYPTSLADINYAIRWLKARAAELDIDPGRIASSGQSSGGHLAMLAAMRPDDPRYAAIPLEAGAPEVDATVDCVAMLWPVINPLSRYRHALRRRASDDPPGWTADIPERHDTYWGDEAAMADGNPMLALEKGEAVATPPAVWIQGRPDEVHDYRDPDSPVDLNEPERFARNYRAAGGECDVVYIDQETRATGAVEPLLTFLRQRLG